METQSSLASVRFFSSVKGASFIDSFLDTLALHYDVKFAHSIDYSLDRTAKNSMNPFNKLWLMYGKFGCQSILEARGQQDLSIVTTNPFFNPWLVAHCSRKEAFVINLLWDVYPDCLELTGIIKPGSVMSKFFEMLTRDALRRCSATVFLGDRLKSYVEGRYGRAKKGVVIPVGADAKPFQNAFPELLPKNEKPLILYSGNLGRMHDISTLSEAICKYAESQVTTLEFVFQANGKNYKKFVESIPSNKSIRYSGRLPGPDWVNLMKRAHVGVVTMKPGSENVVMPSKTYSAMVAGQAIIAICPEVSDLADLIHQHNCGWVVAPGDVDKLSHVFKIIVENPAELHLKRMNSYNVGHLKYNSENVADQWLSLFDQIIA